MRCCTPGAWQTLSCTTEVRRKGCRKEPDRRDDTRRSCSPRDLRFSSCPCGIRHFGVIDSHTIRMMPLLYAQFSHPPSRLLLCFTTNHRVADVLAMFGPERFSSRINRDHILMSKRAISRKTVYLLALGRPLPFWPSVLLSLFVEVSIPNAVRYTEHSSNDAREYRIFCCGFLCP